MIGIDIAYRQADHVSALLLSNPVLRSEDSHGIDLMSRVRPVVSQQEFGQILWVTEFGFTEEGRLYAE
ncbi:MAG TPA: hypothetical protein QF624_10560 [Dehalococcoidia bacterium]|nr:hypothetical protein [Dehalococcoidia bacterium]